MSVLIKGMEMPTTCVTCPCADDESRFCRAAKEYIPMLGHPKFCPLIYVPPHGRLIDADALGAFPYNMDFCDGYEADEWVQNAPTIIPAEDET